MVAAERTRAVLADWGTSKLRLWSWKGGDRVSAPLDDPRGMKYLQPAEFPQVLTEALAALGLSDEADPVPVLICGMAGAAGGWQDAGYLRAPLALSQLGQGAVPVAMPEGFALRDVRILPGVSTLAPAGANVMRGEETQLLGLSDEVQTPLVCMPGTHSKWVERDGDTLRGFTTCMTGEMFEVISRHSILSKTLDEGWDDAAFDAAAAEALAAPERVWAQFFGLRAGVVMGGQGAGADLPASARARLSGLLIGAEVASARATHGLHPVTLVASGPIARAYATTLRVAGFEVVPVNSEDITCRGLIRAAHQIWRD